MQVENFPIIAGTDGNPLYTQSDGSQVSDDDNSLVTVSATNPILAFYVGLTKSRTASLSSLRPSPGPMRRPLNSKD